jgi:acyl-CoA hydrolase
VTETDGDRGRATLAESHTEMTELLLPNDTNNLGRALGGAVLHWMDICGAIAAMRLSNLQCVTAAMDHVDFIAPIDLGEVVVLEAYVFAVGRSSLEVKVDVRAENPKTDDVRETTTSFFTFVALDESGHPTEVPRLACPTAAERERRETAIAERQAQLEAVADRVDGVDDPVAESPSGKSPDDHG